MSTDEKKKALFNNDATSKILGFDYQKLIALERCLNAKPNEYIWIECKGDVADSKTSVEVKHHESKHNLSSNSVDVWKTIKNYVDNSNVIDDFNHLILHTTSTVPEDSIFYEWNKLSPMQKRKKLINQVPVEGTKDFYKKVTECPVKVLGGILKKFLILSDQPRIEEKWEELKGHALLTLVPEVYRDDAVKMMHGYMTKAAIENKKLWHIRINDFRRDMRHVLNKFTTDHVPFHIVLGAEVDPAMSDHPFVFLQKMRDVKLRARDQEKATFEYLRAQMSQVEMLRKVPTLNLNFETYDVNVASQMQDEKADGSYKISDEDVGQDIADKESRDLFFRCINKSHEQIPGVADTQRYYRNGRIHHLIEHSDFEWKYNEGDLCE